MPALMLATHATEMAHHYCRHGLLLEAETHRKTDDIDATAAAVGVLVKDTTQLMYPRAEDVRTEIRGLLATRRRADHQHTGDTAEQRIAREDAIRLAAAVLHAGKLLKHNKEQLAELGEEPAPGCRTGPPWDP